MKTIDIAFLKECLDYNAETGTFFWLERPESHFHNKASWKGWMVRFFGKRAGHLDKLTGYRCICLTGKLWSEHRLAFVFMHGRWPLNVDHINRIKDDNRACNIRECTHLENMANQTSRRPERKKGAYYNKRAGKWHSTICINFKQIHLGYFPDEDSAHQAYVEASRRLRGEFSGD